MQYEDLIRQHIYAELPTPDVSEDIRFEAISAEVFGTKQRRFGPMPKPETQVGIREVIRDSGNTIRFFTPWGCSKQFDDSPLDILEFSALKQLKNLQEGLKRFGKGSEFHFRLENSTDRYLLSEDASRLAQVVTYAATFKRVAETMLDNAHVYTEDRYSEFKYLADKHLPMFVEVLQDKRSVADLEAIGWKGKIPQVQRDYYYRMYERLGIAEPVVNLARYFAAALARVQLGMTSEPPKPFISVAFTHPIPGDPLPRSRVHYRTIPENFTHDHRSPWIAKGVFRISEDNTICPRFWNGEELSHCSIDFAGARIQTDYFLQ